MDNLLFGFFDAVLTFVLYLFGGSDKKASKPSGTDAGPHDRGGQQDDTAPVSGDDSGERGSR